MITVLTGAGCADLRTRLPSFNIRQVRRPQKKFAVAALDFGCVIGRSEKSGIFLSGSLVLSNFIFYNEKANAVRNFSVRIQKEREKT